MNKTLHILSLIMLLAGAATTTHAQTINGNVYGGGDLAQVVGNTNITIKEGGSVTYEQDSDGNIYGGPLRGKL